MDLQGSLQFPCVHVVAVVTGEGCYEEMVEATEALAHRIDQQTVDTLRLKIGGVLQNANPLGPTFPPVNTKPLWTCANIRTSSLCQQIRAKPQ